MANVPTFVGQGQAYDNAEYVLNHARAALNDVMESPAGDILTDDWPSTWTYLNQGKRLVEHELASNGVEFNVKEQIFFNIPPVQNIDPSQQVWISQSGYFDGASNHANPNLPGDLIVPLRLWERFSGTQNPFFQIEPAVDGLSGTLMQVQMFRYWDWRTDAIYLPGATMLNDIRMRYVSYSPELTGPSSVVPFRRSALAIAFMAAWCFANPRGAVNAPTLLAMAQTEMDQIVHSTTHKKQRRLAQKRAYGGSTGWDRPPV